MTDLPTLKKLKCSYCRDGINHVKGECGDTISKKEVIQILKAHAAAHEVKVKKFVAMKDWDFAHEERAAVRAVLALAGKKTIEELEAKR